MTLPVPPERALINAAFDYVLADRARVEALGRGNGMHVEGTVQHGKVRARIAVDVRLVEEAVP
jgi:hypothetical protein